MFFDGDAYMCDQEVLWKEAKRHFFLNIIIHFNSVFTYLISFLIQTIFKIRLSISFKKKYFFYYYNYISHIFYFFYPLPTLFIVSRVQSDYQVLPQDIFCEKSPPILPR